MKEKYRVLCSTGYAILGGPPPKMDISATYYLLEESSYYPHCYVVMRCDEKEYMGNRTWIVHSDSLVRIQ